MEKPQDTAREGASVDEAVAPDVESAQAPEKLSLKANMM